MKPIKPLGRKAYGHIPHIDGSRMGPADKKCNPGHQRIATEKARDGNDLIIVQEKIDGSNCSVAMLEDRSIVALTRSGYAAHSSPYRQHHIFGYWVQQEKERFESVLSPGERICGEWLMVAHGTRYNLRHEPFVIFDIMAQDRRHPFLEVMRRSAIAGFVMPRLLHIGGPLKLEQALKRLDPEYHGAVDPIEGLVWRIERSGEVDTLLKYVRPDKQDGQYLDQEMVNPGFWHWSGLSSLQTDADISAEKSALTALARDQWGGE